MDSRQRNEMTELARRIHRNGWVSNHEGNLTLRLSTGEFLATPTAVSKGAIDATKLIVVDGQGKSVSGRGRVFSEIDLHLAVYAARPEVSAVIHAHPPTATGFAVANVPLDRPTMAETIVSLGPRIPLVPFAPPGAQAAAALAAHCRGAQVCLLANHGVISFGADLEQAYLRMEQVEHLAKVVLVALQLGGLKELPASALAALHEAHRKAFPSAQRAAIAARQSLSVSDAQPTPELMRVITEEITRLLSGR